MARRKKALTALTPLEHQIMQVLWCEGPSNVRQVQKNLLGLDLAYTTVQTMLNVLLRKGRVRRALNGRAFRYRALVSKEAVLQQAVRELVERLFGGSSEELVMRLIKSRQVDPARIAELSRTLATKREAVRARRSSIPVVRGVDRRDVH
jgi:predicted transcriptional regulator